MSLYPSNQQKELFPIIEELREKNKKLINLTELLLKKMKEIDPEYVVIVNKNFWNLLNK